MIIWKVCKYNFVKNFNVVKHCNSVFVQYLKKKSNIESLQIGAKAASELMTYMKKNDVKIVKNFLVPFVQVCNAVTCINAKK